jgi:uncharacterized repeat protein (TIGR03803 family)
LKLEQEKSDQGDQYQMYPARTVNITETGASDTPCAASTSTPTASQHAPALIAVCKLKSISLAAAIATILLLTFASPTFAANTNVSVLHTFTGGNDGSYPDGNLVADAAGNLYGTTQIGGAFGAGTVFELSPTPDGQWRFYVLYTFTGGADGGNPLTSLVFDAAGNAYSTTSSGGANGFGTVFELTPRPGHGYARDEKVLYSFQGGSDGIAPAGGVIFDAQGNLYGSTTTGGTLHIGCPPAKGCGTIYELSPTGNGLWQETVLRRFSDAFGEGATPGSALIFDAAGNLYGTTYMGGNNLYCNGYGCGSVFELMPPSTGKHWRYKNLIDFNQTNGALPWGGVILSPDGSTIYGSTSYGGVNNKGTIFAFTLESGKWKFKSIYSFDGLNGLQPAGNLALDSAGNLYGATYEGGANDWGGIFQLVPGENGADEWTENLLYSFVVSGTRFGANPLGGVMLDAANNLYLTTNQGGNLKYCQPNSGCGVVIKLPTTPQ